MEKEKPKKRNYAMLTDKDRARIIKAYLDCGSLDKVARHFRISNNTVKHVIREDEQFENKFNEQRKAERKALYGYISAKTCDLIKFADMIFDVLDDKDTVTDLIKKDPEKMVRVFGMLFDRLSIILDMDDLTGVTEDGQREITVNIIRQHKKKYADDNEEGNEDA